MKPDPGLKPTRDIRVKISREFGNDPRRLVEYYLAYQRKFGTRLRPAHGRSRQVSDEAATRQSTPRR
ncbi:MAG: hypothetical protein FJ280_11140 [Planctomycetes bacterium]|nr:hypothetical protein [Planctomycetota bacterium]